MRNRYKRHGKPMCPECGQSWRVTYWGRWDQHPMLGSCSCSWHRVSWFHRSNLRRHAAYGRLSAEESAARQERRVRRHRAHQDKDRR
jgi:hypothetical protein